MNGKTRPSAPEPVASRNHGKGLTEAEYADWYTAVHANVLRFVASRLIPRDQARAEDVTHEAFLVAWRRLPDIPRQPSEALAWILGVARNCLLHSNRINARNQNLNVRIAESAASFVPGPSDAVGSRLDLAAAWNRLDAKHQEAIALQVWDGLTTAEAARVLNISEANYRKRLSRARTQLNRELATPSEKPAPATTKASIAPIHNYLLQYNM